MLDFTGWLTGDSISKKRKNVRTRDVVIFFDQKPIFLRIDLEKKFFLFFFIEHDSFLETDTLSILPQGFINNIKNAILFPCLLHQHRNRITFSVVIAMIFNWIPVSCKGDTKNYSFALFTILYINYISLGPAFLNF